MGDLSRYIDKETTHDMREWISQLCNLWYGERRAIHTVAPDGEDNGEDV